MANLLTNGTFDSSMTGWTTGGGTAAWSGGWGKPHPGCALLGSTDESNIYQEVAITSGTYLLAYWLYTSSIPDNEQQSAEVRAQVGTAMLHTEYIYTADNAWYLFAHTVPAPTGTFKVTLTLKQTGFAYFDTVGLALYTGGEFISLVRQLRNLRRDPVAIKHSDIAYEQAINRALAMAPRELWALVVDTSLTTVAEQRRYTLSAISAITEAGQLLRAWMEDSDGNDREIGGWEIEDNAGALTLVLDADPPEAGRTITVEYRGTPSELVYPWDSAGVDPQWVLYKAMTLLLLEADTMLEDPNILAADLQRWDALRQQREAELNRRARRAPSKIRTRAW